MIKEDFWEQIDSIIPLLKKTEGKFTLPEFIGKIGTAGTGTAQNKTVEKEDQLRGLFDETGLALTKDSVTYTPASWFFRDGALLIKPTESELETGVLIPGHRFVPFYFQYVPPREIELVTQGGGKQKRKTVAWEISDALIFFSLFGYHRYFEFLALEDETNIDILRSNVGATDALIRLSAIDMKQFYEENNFAREDYIQCTLRDYYNGVFDFTYLPAGKVTEKAAEKSAEEWKARMDEGFERSFDSFGSPADPFIQIAYAYYFAGRDAVTGPALHLGGYIAESESVGIQVLGNRSYIWRQDENLEDSLFQSESPTPQTGTTESLDAILEDVGSALTSSIIEAYLRDARYEDEDIDDAADRFMRKSNAVFASYEQSGAFWEMVDEMWDELIDGFDSETEKMAAPLRKLALDIVDGHIAWLRKLDRKGVLPEELPRETLLQLGEGIQYMENVLKLLNNPEQIKDDIDQLPRETIEEMGTIVDDMHKTIEEELKKKDVVEGDENTYILKISLKHIKPPIWRRLQVPSGLTLEELHDVIQDAFDWEDYHLHSFVIDGVEYTDLDTIEDDLFGMAEDETETTLDELGLQEKGRFEYTYDFGDNWEHVIVVEKVIPNREIPEDTRGKPVCLKGKRAVPPEDCGGVFGYDELLQLIETPKDDLDSDEQEFLEWAGDFDPDYFDLDEINKRLNG